MNARNGKFTHLPRQIREKLNERLERSGESPSTARLKVHDPPTHRPPRQN